MTTLPRRSLLGLAAALPVAAQARAQADWPRQPVRIMIPFAPGGVPDIVARLVAPQLQGTLGQPVLVENRPGAGGTIAAEAAARSTPDGYTLFMTTVSTQAIAPGLFANLRYDPDRDFAPISLIARVPLVLLVPPSLGVRNVQELIALLKREPGRHAFASSGVGAPLHLAGELFRQLAGVEATHVPYRGSTPALTDLMAGRVSFMFDALPPAVPFIADGRLVALAVGTTERARARPEIPAMREAGVAEFEAYTWAALYAPAGTPTSIVQRLHQAVAQAARQPEIAARLEQLGYEAVISTPEDLAIFQRRERQKWAEVIRRGNITVEN
jgi:tripartite-type tricarboxylate transporter receptor subunit TctC